MNDNHAAILKGGKVVRNMVRGLLAGLITLSVAGIAVAQNNNEGLQAPTLKFKGGIGVITVTGVAASGAANLNVVRGVTPGSPWRIADLEATVGADGHIRVNGRGL